MSEKKDGDDRHAGGDIDALLLEALLEVRRVGDTLMEIVRVRGMEGKEGTGG
jgi:hypothetical protein